MRRYAKRFWVLAAAMAALAGYVDAIGYLKLGGLFVSFMSGNSTRLAVGAASGDRALALVASGLVAAFVLGVVAGSLTATAAGARRKPLVLALVAGLLAAAALLERGGPGRRAAFVLAAAMGAENAVFERDGEVSIGVTYMTGTLVKLGQRVAAALLGGPGWAWLPYLALWSGPVAGALAGAASYARLGTASIWAAAVAAAVLAGAAAALGPARSGRR